jgi:hypothetical protein
MALGTEENNPAVRLINLINSSDYLSEYLEAYFSRMGELANLEAEKKNKERSSLETSTPVGRLRQKYVFFKGALRSRVVNLIKSVPFLRKTAYTILRIVRR